MPKFSEQIIENHFWNDDDLEIPDFPSGSEKEIWHKSEEEIELDGHIW